MSIQKRNNCLIASITSLMSDQDMIDLRDQLVTQATDEHATGIILDVSELDVLDSFSVRMLRDMANSVSLKGARTVVVGIQPDVAWTMVQQGLTFKDIHTALDRDDGLEYFSNN